MMQIENFKAVFFNEMVIDMSSIQALRMNQDEKNFLKEIVRDNLDIIKLFPVLY